MKNDLLLEGAVAGHMNHVYDNGEMTFGELKQLLQAAAAGKLRGTEKTDGQNIYLSFDVKSNRAVGIRNKTMISAGGLDSDKMDLWFSDHPSQAIRYSFVEAIKEFEKLIISLNLDEAEKTQIFGPGVEYDYTIEDVKKYTQWKKLYKEKRASIKNLKGAAKKAKEMTEEILGQLPVLGSTGELRYYNTEVMNPGNPKAPEGDPRRTGTTNVIPYDKKTLLFHRVGHQMFRSNVDDATGKANSKAIEDNPGESNVKAENESSFSKLESLLKGKEIEDPSVFSVETNPIRNLPPIKDKEVLSATLAKIDNLMSDSKIKPGNTINQYVMSQLGPQIDRLDLPEDIKDLILLRIMEIEDEETGNIPSLTYITKGLPEDMKSRVSDFVNNFNYSSYTSSLEMSLHDFSVAMIDGLNSSFISDNENAVFQLQKMASDYKEAIENSSNEEAKLGLKKQWDKLKHVKNINTPSEGFVFTFNGVTYKFTGSFAPLNQIIGIRKYGRYGPIDQEGDQDDSELGQNRLLPGDKPSTIAIFPGSFKPPHRGHLQALVELSKDVDVCYVIVSKPQFSTRTLPISGVSIDADQAVQCWHAMLDKTSIKNKTQVVIGDEASPITTTIKFVTQPVNPENFLIAPKDATVVLGVGAKDKDAERFNDKLIDNAKQSRPDLKIVAKAVGPFRHDPEYLSFLKNNPIISQGLNKGKGRLSPDEITDEERLEGKIADKHLFHASDMRYAMDLASQDPLGLKMLQFFVPSQEDALAVLGIIGINPADEINPESDQVREPEVDQLSEIIKKEAEMFLERFKHQRAPKAGPSKSKFQRKMRKRLSKAHSFYLDMGRKDLTKHGGGYRKNRKKNVSNAFLAEEDIAEMSAMAGAAGGSVEGAGNGFNTRKYKRNDKMLTQEKKTQMLRIKIKKSLKEFFNLKSKQHYETVANILEEHQLRMQLRRMIVEQSLNEVEDPEIDLHDSTGINTLKDLLKNTNVLATLRKTYKTLTTDADQKMSFRAHIVKWVQDTLAPVKLNDLESLEPSKISEDVDVDLKGVEPEKFIDAPDGSEKDTSLEPEDEEDDGLKGIAGADTTGRNKAERVYPNIEKSVVDYFSELDNPEDQEMFYDYLIANMKLYFDKWDNESSKTPPKEPTNNAYQQAKQPQT
tara:strand:- start:5699 stop:9133 length:3435 start_codon:yes stop_codon:yes gene_type:complete